MDFIKKLAQQTADVYNALTPGRRVFILISVFLTIGTLVGLILWTTKIDYKPLYTGLSSEDAGAVIGKLRDKKVKYRIGPDGSTIFVPGDVLYEIRMEMASEGFPVGGGIGYEIFDEQNIGITEFVQKVNLQRALQGELSRTITQFSEVRRARVHLSIPEKSIFVDDQEKARASVVLTLQAGRALSQGQLRGISNLVASSVEGLAAEDVIIVDSHGKMLAGGKDETLFGGLSLSQQKLQEAIEKKMERKIETLLGGVVGHDKVTAKVSASLNFTQVEQTEETFDPETATVRSEQRSSEKSSGRKAAISGTPGVMSNTPDLKTSEQAAPVRAVDYNKSNEVINYEISRVTKRVINPVGAIKRLSTAVLVDGTYVTEKDGEGDEIRKYIPRTDNELKKYENLVKRAVGYDEDRNDSVEVVNIQFEEIEQEVETVVDRMVRQIDIQSLITYVITAVLFAMFFIFGLKPLMRLLTSTVSETEAVKRIAEGAGAEEEEEELPEIGVSQDRGGRHRQLMDFAKKNPRLFAQYLKSMMR